MLSLQEMIEISENIDINAQVDVSKNPKIIDIQDRIQAASEINLDNQVVQLKKQLRLVELQERFPKLPRIELEKLPYLLDAKPTTEFIFTKHKNGYSWRMPNIKLVSYAMSDIKKFPSQIPYGVMLRIKELEKLCEKFWIFGPRHAFMTDEETIGLLDQQRIQLSFRTPDPILVGEVCGEFYFIAKW